MFRINVTVEGEVIVDRLLQGIDDRSRDLTPVWPAVVREFRGIVAKAFASEGASTGAPWAQLAPSTQADRRRHGFPPAHPILQRSGKLVRALTIGDGAYVATTATSVRYILSEQEVGYFKYHQSLRPRVRLPRRAPVLLTADQRTELVHPIRLFITGRDPNAPRRGRVG